MSTSLFLFFFIIAIITTVALVCWEEKDKTGKNCKPLTVQKPKSKKELLNNPAVIVLAILYFPVGLIFALAKNFK